MRILLTILVSASCLFARAQSHLPIGAPFMPYFSPITPNLLSDSSKGNPKWQVRSFASLSAGTIFLNGGISYLSAPVGLVLFRPLNKNVTAFGSVSAAPTLFSMGQLYNQPYPGNNFSRTGLGLNARVEGGLMYTNDAKTFSISGSVGVERGSYPVYPYNRPNTKKQ